MSRTSRGEASRVGCFERRSDRGRRLRARDGGDDGVSVCGYEAGRASPVRRRQNQAEGAKGDEGGEARGGEVAETKGKGDAQRCRTRSEAGVQGLLEELDAVRVLVG